MTRNMMEQIFKAIDLCIIAAGPDATDKDKENADYHKLDILSEIDWNGSYAFPDEDED